MSHWRLSAYGALGFALAFSALAIHMLVPAYYGQQLGVSLQTIGLILFATRMLDACQDPWLGRLADRLWQIGRLQGLMVVMAGALIAGFALLWSARPGDPAPAWRLVIALILTYVAHSFINISYLTWGGKLSGDVSTLTKASAWREGAGLLGVIGAAMVPQWQADAAGTTLITLFSATLALGLLLLLSAAPRPDWTASATRAQWGMAWTIPALRRLLLAFFLSSTGSAIAATLALFFIADRLGAAQSGGLFLAIYFVAAACGLPFWTHFSARVGAQAAWRYGLLFNGLIFLWALTLNNGDTLAYFAICLLTGAALGADLALPPVLLAQALPEQEPPASWFGIWALLTKLALALAGLALPALAMLGYQPGATDGSNALTAIYAGLPSLLKLAAAWLVQQPAPDRAMPHRSSTQAS